MKHRLSLLIPLILVIVSLASSYLFYLQMDRSDQAVIHTRAMTHATLQMAGLQSSLYNRLTAGDEQQALLSLSLAATDPRVRTLMLVDEHHRVLMGNHYSWRGAMPLLSPDFPASSQIVFSAAVSGDLPLMKVKKPCCEAIFRWLLPINKGGWSRLRPCFMSNTISVVKCRRKKVKY